MLAFLNLPRGLVQCIPLRLACTARHLLKSVAISGILALMAIEPAAAQSSTSRTVVALVAAAQKEFDAGNFARAAELFLEAWRRDPSQVGALYNAARTTHMSGNLEKAEELYRECLTAAPSDATIRLKVEGYLAEIAHRRAEKKAEMAANAEGQGSFALAATLWADAVALWPEKAAWLLRQGRALQLSGDKVGALAAFDRYLALPSDKAPERQHAERWRTELATKESSPVPAVPSPPPVTLPVASAPKPDLPKASTVPWGGYGCGFAGVATIIGGVIAYRATAAEVDKFAASVALPASGKVVSTSYEAANAERDRLNIRMIGSQAAIGAGALLAAIGTWLVFRSPATSVSMHPQGSGIAISGRF